MEDHQFITMASLLRPLKCLASTLVLAASVFIAGCASAPEQPIGTDTLATADTGAQPPLSDYVLSAGDTVAITVYEEKDLSITTKIEPDGSINFPLIGRIRLAGETYGSAENLIERKLGQGYLVNPDVRVAIVKFQPVYVGGEVARAGAYPYSLGLTVQRAITLAGGRTRFASSKVVIQRGGSDSASSFRAEPETLVFPGDIITVSERLF